MPYFINWKYFGNIYDFNFVLLIFFGIDKFEWFFVVVILNIAFNDLD